MLLRIVVTDKARKPIVCDAGAISRLVDLLQTAEPALVLTIVETLSCLLAGDPSSRVRASVRVIAHPPSCSATTRAFHCIQAQFRDVDGVGKFVRLFAIADPNSQMTHRLLLALCILSDKQVDRASIIEARGVQQLINCLDPRIKRDEVRKGWGKRVAFVSCSLHCSS